jgi:hypothetical protein
MIQREISIYEPFGDQWIASLQIDITPEQLSTFLEAFDDDPDYYRPYAVDQLHYDLLIALVPELHEYKLSHFAIYLEAFEK